MTRAMGVSASRKAPVLMVTDPELTVIANGERFATVDRERVELAKQDKDKLLKVYQKYIVPFNIRSNLYVMYLLSIASTSASLSPVHLFHPVLDNSLLDPPSTHYFMTLNWF